MEETTKVIGPGQVVEVFRRFEGKTGRSETFDLWDVGTLVALDGYGVQIANRHDGTVTLYPWHLVGYLQEA